MTATKTLKSIALALVATTIVATAATRPAAAQDYATSPQAQAQAQTQTRINQLRADASSQRLALQMQTGHANMAALRAKQGAIQQGYNFGSQLRTLRRTLYW